MPKGIKGSGPKSKKKLKPIPIESALVFKSQNLQKMFAERISKFVARELSVFEKKIRAQIKRESK